MNHKPGSQGNSGARKLHSGRNFSQLRKTYNITEKKQNQLISPWNEESEIGVGVLYEMEEEYKRLRVMLEQWIYANVALEKSFGIQEKDAIENLYKKWRMTCDMSRVVAMEEMHIEREEEKEIISVIVEKQHAFFKQASMVLNELYSNYKSLTMGLESTTQQVPVSSCVMVDIPKLTESLRDTKQLSKKLVEELCGKEGGGKEMGEVCSKMKKLIHVIEEQHTELEEARGLLEQVKCLSREEESLRIQIMTLKDELDCAGSNVAVSRSLNIEHILS